MFRLSKILASSLFVLASVSGPGQAETLAGRVDAVNVVTGEIVIDGIRYTLARTTREPGGGKPLLSRYQPGDGVVFTPGPGRTLLRIEKPAGGVDLPARLQPAR